MSPPRAQLVHRVPGRLRLRVPDRRGQAGYFEQAGAGLAAHPAVSAAEANPVTATILVRHAAELSIDELARFAREGGLFELQPGLPGAVPSTRQVASQLRELDRTVRNISRGEADLRSLALVGLLGLAVLQALRGQLLGPASTLIGQAFQLVDAGPPGQKAAG